MLGLRLDGYEPDLHHDAAVAFCIQAREDELLVRCISTVKAS